jgi:hypothetical protein
MLRTIRYLPLILVVSVLFPSWLWSQQKTSAPPMPIPDFSGAVDLTEHHPIEYQEYEKGLLAKLDIDAALRSPLDYTGVPLRVLLKSRVDADGKKKVPFSTVIPSTGVRVDTADNNHVFIEISYAVLSADGNSTAKQDKSYNLNLNAEQMKQFTAMGLGFTDSVELPPGSQKLRVVVRDNLSGRVGSVLADIHAD